MATDEREETEHGESMPAGAELEKAMARAYRVYQDNVRETGELVFRLIKGARDGVPEKELLETALEALSRCRSPQE